MCAEIWSGEPELDKDEIATLKRIEAGEIYGTKYTTEELAPLLHAGYIVEYMRPVITITDEGAKALAELKAKEAAAK